VPKLTTTESALLATNLASLQKEIKRLSCGDEVPTATFAEILAQIIQQMGPVLLQILIALLTDEENTTEK